MADGRHDTWRLEQHVKCKNFILSHFNNFKGTDSTDTVKMHERGDFNHHGRRQDCILFPFQHF